MHLLNGNTMNTEDKSVKMGRTCIACPEQYEGTVDGLPAYFRIRHSYWRFCITKLGGNPIRGVDSVYFKDGVTDGPDEGIMDDAPGLIMSLVVEFRLKH